MELAQSTNAYHRHLVQMQKVQNDQAERHLPSFAKDSSQGRVKSQLGNRAKYQRLMSKKLQARDAVHHDGKKGSAASTLDSGATLSNQHYQQTDVHNLKDRMKAAHSYRV